MLARLIPRVHDPAVIPSCSLEAPHTVTATQEGFMAKKVVQKASTMLSALGGG
jgi:hypothetical protein